MLLKLTLIPQNLVSAVKFNPPRFNLSVRYVAYQALSMNSLGMLFHFRIFVR